MIWLRSSDNFLLKVTIQDDLHQQRDTLAYWQQTGRQALPFILSEYYAAIRKVVRRLQINGQWHRADMSQSGYETSV